MNQVVYGEVEYCYYPNKGSGILFVEVCQKGEKRQMNEFKDFVLYVKAHK